MAVYNAEIFTGGILTNYNKKTIKFWVSHEGGKWQNLGNQRHNSNIHNQPSLRDCVLYNVLEMAINGLFVLHAVSLFCMITQ